MINVVTIEGNVTRDAETSQVSGRNGTSTVFRFGIAQNARRGGSEEAMFFDVEMWATSDAQAQFYGNVLRKGAHVVLSGQLRQHSWEKDGQRRSAVSVNARDIAVCGGNGQQPRGQQQATAYHQSQAPAGYQQPQAQQQVVYDSDIPF